MKFIFQSPEGVSKSAEKFIEDIVGISISARGMDSYKNTIVISYDPILSKVDYYSVDVSGTIYI